MIRFVIIILFLTISVFIFFTQTSPYFDEVKILKNEKQSLDEALQYSRELQTLRNDFLEKYNAISREDIGRLNKIIPSEISSGEMITILEDRVKTRGLLLKKIDVSEQKTAQGSLQDLSVPIGAPPPPFRTINLSLYISGFYDAFLLFLEDLESSLRVIDIDQINFSSGMSDIMEFKITAHTYVAFPVEAVSGFVSGTEQNRGIREILAMLAQLKAIKIDSDLFQGGVFKSLQEFAPIITIPSPSDYGRPNPFRPMK